MEEFSDAKSRVTYSLIPFAAQHAGAFKALNLSWISEHWEPEPADFQVLDHPQREIIDPGGYIAIALLGDTVAGTCALKKMDNANYELAKMAVAKHAQGLGIGLALAEHIISQATTLGATRMYLESNTVLGPALNLYRRLGFREIERADSAFQRCNIQMELYL